jgi:hypothetical protein
VEYSVDPDLALQTFCSIVNELISKQSLILVKEKTIKFDTQPKWFTDEIQAMIFLRDKYHKNEDFDEYKLLRNKIN